MRNHEIDKLLEESFSGDPPDPAFRTRVLGDSVAALNRARRTRVRRRWLRFAVAATFIAGVSFLLGRHAASPSVPSPPPGPIVAEPTATMMVSSDLVAWLDAARLFKQLGMEDRMAHAIERAGKLRPYQGTLADHSVERGLAATGDQAAEKERNSVGLAVLPRLYEPIRSTDGIMAHSFGGGSHASERD